MASWFKCRVCTARFTDDLGMGVGTILRCPSCGVSNPERCEGLDERPTQSPLFQLPVVPRPTRWKIEWQWTPACRQNTQEIFNETLPEGWFFHSEYSTERQAVNSLFRLRRRDAPNRHCTIRARHHRMRPCLWSHSGDIELVLPKAPAGTFIVSSVDAIATQLAAKAAEFINKSIDPATLGPYCGTDYCDDPACLTHGDKPTKSQMSETELYESQFQSQYLDPTVLPPDPWNEKQTELPELDIDAIIAGKL